jgi:CheY-like chemotaxis protein
VGRKAVDSPVVLVVDDDGEVREIVVEIFETNGFTVLEARNGFEALDILSRNRAIDLLFTDVRMPGLSGPTLAQRARELIPDIRVILTSGYMEHEDDGELPVVEKPFRMHDLMQAVHGALH